MDRSVEQNRETGRAQWLINIDTLLSEFDQIPYFDESLRGDSKNMFFIMGARSRIYPDEVYTKVFPNLPE